MRTPRDASPALVALDSTSLKWESKRQSYDRFRRGKALFVRCGAGTRSDVLAGKLPFLPGGFDIASNLIQVRKVMTRQESQHHIQRTPGRAHCAGRRAPDPPAMYVST